MTSALDSFCSAVERNCDIANANHAASSTLCVYLLKMREYYRWKNGLPFDAALDQKMLGRWLQAQEAHWETIEDQPYQRLVIDARSFDPFEAGAINDMLVRRELVYSAGIGMRGAVHFFLGSLLAKREAGEFDILISGTEHARDASALPAMSMDNTVFIRRDAIERMLWEKAQEASWHGHATPMRRALDSYAYGDDPYGAIALMAERELETFVQHEIGELQAGRLLGSAWRSLLAQALGHVDEPLIRAVRDNLADALATLPYLLEHFRPAGLHFYVSTLGPLRKSLQPSLCGAYEVWCENGELAPLQNVSAGSVAHWVSVAHQLLHDGSPIADTQAFIESHSL